MRQYEMMIIVDPEVDDRQVPATLEKFLTVIKNDKGTVDNLDVWGRRRMAFDINKKTEGIYVVLTFTSEPATAQEMDRQLGLSELILRTKLLRPGA